MLLAAHTLAAATALVRKEERHGKFHWRTHDARHHQSDGNYEIAPGDLLVYTSNVDAAQPPSSITHGASEAVDQQAVHDKFLGVAQTTAHSNGTPSKIRVAVNGVFNMIASGDIPFGSLVGSVTTGTTIESHKVKVVTNKKYAIGTAQTTAVDGGNVQVRISGVVFDDGRVAIAS